MKYVGIRTQIHRNNILSIVLLVMFPVIILAVVWLFLVLLNALGGGYYDNYGNMHTSVDFDGVMQTFISVIPWVVGAVAIWFAIAYFANTAMIRKATGARPLERKENPRVYNIVENLCMAGGMDMPKINVVDDDQLNAYASGINKDTYTVTLTTGIINLLSDEELSGVVGHELTHIRNRDTRLLITSVVFVGIVSTVMSLAVRMLYNNFIYGGNVRVSSSNNDREGGGGLSIVIVLFVAMVCSAIAYIFTLMTRFAISRKREYMADAGGAELCGNPLALASALRKISDNPGLGQVERDDIAQMYIIHPKKMTQGLMNFISGLFATHPSTEERIRILEQF